MKSIEAFLKGLSGIPEAEFTTVRVADYVRHNPVDARSLSPYLVFEATHYTRNLIHRCELFELMCICWEVGQGSRIHNHQGQCCWMATPMGRLVVQNYDVIEEDAHGYCRLRPAERAEMDLNQPQFVDPKRPIHAVINPEEFGERAASLHVYSRPFDRCLVYSLEENSYAEMPLCFDTEQGRRVVEDPDRR